MLKGISPLITPELLKLLMEMGHDDALVLVDANFTAHSVAGGKPVLRMPGIGMVQAIKAITALLPLATDVDHPVAFMEVCASAWPSTPVPASRLTQLHREVIGQLAPLMLPKQRAEAVERFAFYDRARAAYAIVVTGEMQPFGNFILRKGVICDPLSE
jgi:L-fucose mutarotase